MQAHAEVPGHGRVIVVMGVSGCGKSTVARHLAIRLRARFRDGDELHPPQNIALMAEGTPLTDQDRWPWLEAVRDFARVAVSDGQDCVIACSALRLRYRDMLRQAGEVYFVFLDGPFELIASRMQNRSGHFMPEHLLQSQFDTLESPLGEPGVVRVDVEPVPEEVARAAQQALHDLPRFDPARTAGHTS